MISKHARRPTPATGLSARLLALTVVFVMIAEVLIYVPSIARFRLAYLENQIAKAHLAVLAVEATPDQKVGQELAQDLLFHADAAAIALNEPDRRMLMLSRDVPPDVDVTFDLRQSPPLTLIADALAVMARGEDRVLRVIGTSPRRPDATLEVVLYEAPMRDAMVAFSIRILTLSIIISLITATLVYVSLQWLMVRPILQLTESMTRFRERPEDETAAIRPGTRRDEIGVAERELATMQTDLRQALIEKTRLAALGAAVAKINHDLRNTLSTAVLASDRLGSVSDPEVQRVLPQLYKAIDRAVALCSRTLDFVQDVRASVRRERLTVGLLVSDLAAALREAPSAAGGLRVIAEGGMDLAVDGDRDQLFRVFHNLALNAAQAGAAHLRVQARSGPVGSPQAGQRHLVIEFADDGPGIPDSVRDRLFQPFAISTRPGGSGLGLSIAREIVAAHGGKLVLAATGAEGTIFRIELPSPS